MFDLTKLISEFLYEWILNIDEGDKGSLYQEIFANAGSNCGHGMELCLFFLIGVSALAAVFFYFIIASNILGATKKNYLLTYVVGYIVLVIVNYVGLDYLTGSDEVFSSFNVFKVCLIDTIYYTACFEIFSLIFKPFSKAGDIEFKKAIFD